MLESGSFIPKIIEIAPILRELLGDEYVITVSDTEKFLYYSPGIELNLKIQPGDLIKQGSMTHRCLQSGKRLTTKADSKLYGVPYMGSVICLRDQSKNTVGTLGLILPTTRLEKMVNMSEKLVVAVNQISSNATNLTASAEELASSVQVINTNTQQMLDDVKNTDSILQLINEVASQTHLLGLNAAIEAARAGEQGRGFNVVAEEIRKLAGRTNTSVKDIKEIIGVIKNHIEAMATHINEIADVTEEQSAAAQEIVNFVVGLEGIGEALKQIAGELAEN